MEHEELFTVMPDSVTKRHSKGPRRNNTMVQMRPRLLATRVISLGIRLKEHSNSANDFHEAPDVSLEVV